MNNIIYDYFTQHELLNIFYLNCNRYKQIKQYIKFKKFCLINNNLFNNDPFDNNNLFNLKYGCKNNYIIFIKKINIQLNWNMGLFYACEGGHIDIIKMMIKKGASYWDYGFKGACSSGHINIVKLMIEYGANDWNGGLFQACKGGHIEIVKLMIESGTDALNWGLEGACFGCHMSIIKLMIDKGADYCNWCNKSIQEHLQLK